MATLIADRFLAREASVGLDTAAVELDTAAVGLDIAAVGLDFSRAIPALDLATGAHVRIRIDRAGTRGEQQSWTEHCVRAHADGVLIDFGFIGSSARFEARAPRRERHRQAADESSALVVGWLEHARPLSCRVFTVDE
ncbi:MAG TPA: hypothetical protein VFO48_12325, partial [Vicinamibacterales bacterium]|nr:hypothetical protein [Vicinamibacterales bacterium]